MLRLADGHAAAVRAGAGVVFALSNDGLIVRTHRILPVVRMRAEVEIVFSLRQGDRVALTRHIRGEKLGVIRRRAGGELDRVFCCTFRRGSRGDADLGFSGQAARADGDGFTVAQIEVAGSAAFALFIRAAVAVQRAVLPVVRDLHIAGNGHVGIYGHIYAAAATVGGCGVVAGDGAAGHGEGAAVAAVTGHIHAAAAVCGVVARDGTFFQLKFALAHIHAAAVAAGALGAVAGDGAVLHGEGAGIIIEAGHTHAAAIAVRACGLVAGNGSCIHGKCAAVDIHTTAAAGCRVVGDGSTAAHGEAAAFILYIYAAAVARCRVAGDSGTAAHGECAADAVHIHAAAVAGADTICSAVAGDGGTAAHGECAVEHIHTAAALAERLVAGACAAADGAVLHAECAVVDIHTAAAAASGLVAGDGAAVHVECAFVVCVSGICAHIYAAAAAVCAGRFVAGDLAAVHGEGGTIIHIHAAAITGDCIAGNIAAVHDKLGVLAIHRHAAAILVVTPVGDFSILAGRSLAVGQGKGSAGVHDNGVRINIRLNVAAIEAQHHAVLRLPCTMP